MKATRHTKRLLHSNLILSLCVAALATLAVLLIVLTSSPASTVAAHTQTTPYHWYFKPRNDGLQPIVADNATFLSKYENVYCMGDSSEKCLYLTFDVGYENGNTESILNTLKELQVPAAFFVTGHYLKTNPTLIVRMKDEGHVVGNHTMNHADLTKISDPAVFAKEVTGLSEAYQEITGEAMPRYLRPPEGKYSEQSIQMSDELGYKTIFWSFAYKDWLNDDQPTAEAAKSKILERTHPGAIILLHSNSATNAQILSDVVQQWREQGYTLKSLNDFQPAASTTI